MGRVPQGLRRLLAVDPVLCQRALSAVRGSERPTPSARTARRGGAGHAEPSVHVDATTSSPFSPRSGWPLAPLRARRTDSRMRERLER